ncbi:MAG: sulfatase, partial [Acidobacteria bacterium]|nr:sulfatase [Acidobacteriota bacterium]
MSGPIEISVPPQAPTAPVPGDLLKSAAWFGLVTASAELAIRSFGVMVPLERLAWTIPAAELVLFVAFGTLLTVASRLAPRLVSWNRAVATLAFLSVLSVLLRFDRLHVAAALLLAAGGAVQIARLAARHRARVTWIWNRSLVWLGALFVMLVCGIHGRRLIAEQLTLRGLPPNTADAPNVLLIVLDTARAANMSAYGYPRETTPNLTRFAQEGATFTRAVATSSWTLPTHGSLFMGREAADMPADWFVPLDRTSPTLAEVLRARGYATGAFIANVRYGHEATGLERGFIRYDNYRARDLMLSSSLFAAVATSAKFREMMGRCENPGFRRADSVSDAFLDWIDGLSRDRRFYGFLNYFDTHDVYCPPPPYDTRFASTTTERAKRWVEPGRTWTRRQIDRELAAYDGAIAYLDAQLGRLLEALRRRALLDRTLVIVTADHGEEFGEHRFVGHGKSLYWLALHVPLMMRLPGPIPTGTVCAQPVSLRDVPATVMDLVQGSGVG